MPVVDQILAEALLIGQADRALLESNQNILERLKRDFFIFRVSN